ncbi:YlqD family protein [Priestia koreensis]|uniref:YlqD family protein n=1 Tax=Priestia koreensis TaxID=284581 RepID=UPI00203FBCF4|nr:YlqD family protein [Priestia koreensis]MCM3003797.1 YlqD family protein [Priestia koreensis]
MEIIQKVMVKQILTDNSKKKLLDRFNERKSFLQQELEQLSFQLKRLEKTKKTHSVLLEQQFEKERATRIEKIKILDFQIEQLHTLSIGSELVEKEIEGLVPVQVGDAWENVQQEKSIIVKDGIIVEIR